MAELVEELKPLGKYGIPIMLEYLENRTNRFRYPIYDTIDKHLSLFDRQNARLFLLSLLDDKDDKWTQSIDVASSTLGPYGRAIVTSYLNNGVAIEISPGIRIPLYDTIDSVITEIQEQFGIE